MQKGHLSTYLGVEGGKYSEDLLAVAIWSQKCQRRQLSVKMTWMEK